MTTVEIYTIPTCPYCRRAKRLLDGKGVAYEEVDVMMNPPEKKTMTARAGGRTSVPQIFIGGDHVGGCDDLHALEARGALDPMLGAS